MERQQDKFVIGAIAAAGMAAAGMSNPAQGYSPSEEQRKEPTVRVSVEISATHNFADAFMAAMDGHHVTRHGWNAGGQYVAMQMVDQHATRSRPYLYLKTAQNEILPWLPSQGDLFARDWAILPR